MPLPLQLDLPFAFEGFEAQKNSQKITIDLRGLDKKTVIQIFESLGNARRNHEHICPVDD